MTRVLKKLTKELQEPKGRADEASRWTSFIARLFA